MAQLKVKQISDFVSAVATVHNGAIGTGTVTGISTAKSEAISTAVVNGDAAYDAKGSATAAAGSALSDAKVYADTSETDAINSSVSQAEAKDVLRASTAVLNIANAKAEAISTAVVNGDAAYDALGSAADALSDAKVYSDIQKDRVTTLLGGSTAALDTFGEIKTFIDGLSDADVTIIEAVALNSAKVGITTGQSDAIVANSAKVGITTGQSDAIVANSAKVGITVAQSTAIVDNTAKVGITTGQSSAIVANTAKISFDAESSGKLGLIEARADVTDVTNVTAAGALMDSEVTNLAQVKAFSSADYATAAQGLLADSALQDATAFDAKGDAANALLSATSYADQAEVDAVASAKSYTDTEISDLDTELRLVISGVAGTDKLEQLATFRTTTTFVVADQLSQDNNDILVFVNGLQIHASSEGVDGFSYDGTTFTVSSLGYSLESNDHIVVIGVAA